MEQLVERESTEDPRRGIGHEKVLTRLELDHQAERLLEAGGARRATRCCPRATIFYLRSTGQPLDRGNGGGRDRRQLHPDVRDMAERAAQRDRPRRLRRRLPDHRRDEVSRSFKETHGAICEVNAAPGFRMHVSLRARVTPRDVAGPVMDMLCSPPGTPSRDPHRLHHGHQRQDHHRPHGRARPQDGRPRRVGLATTDGVYSDGHLHGRRAT